MIVLNWFKTMVNRLFGPDEEKVEEITRNEEEYIVMNYTKQFPNENRKPAFRFPLISDEEINSVDNRNSSERADDLNSTFYGKDEFSSDYETIPLYENERWPGDHLSGNVFKAGSNLKYEYNETQQDNSSPDIQIIEDRVSPRKPTIIQKRSNRPFSLTAVPSPVHGFMKPQKKDADDVVENSELLQANESFLKQHDVAVEIESEETLVEEEVEVEEKPEVNIQIEASSKMVDIEEESDITATHTETIKSNEDQLTYKKKEAIVPFNVLMLKSDKEKLLNGNKVQMETIENEVPKTTQYVSRASAYYCSNRRKTSCIHKTENRERCRRKRSRPSALRISINRLPNPA